MRRWVQWQNWTNVILGLWLLVAPAVLGTITTEGARPWNSWLLGVAIAVIALLGLAIPNSRMPESVNIVLGVWLFVSPWVLGFAGLAAAAWNAWIVGILVIVFSGWALAETRGGSSAGTERQVR